MAEEVKKPTFKTINWSALVKAATKNEPKKTVAYKFSNGRKFYHKDDPYADQ